MKRILIYLLASIPFFANAATDGERIVNNLNGTWQFEDPVIHVSEVYKTIDSLKLKIDIFYTNQ